MLAPRLCNFDFNDLATNFTGTNSMLTGGSLVTFTNVYIYGGPNGQTFGNDGTHSGVGGIFYSNSYSYLYFTVGSPYNAVTNANTIEIYQFAYNYPSTASVPFAKTTIGGQPIPTHCYQLSGVYNNLLEQHLNLSRLEYRIMSSIHRQLSPSPHRGQKMFPLSVGRHKLAQLTVFMPRRI